MVPESVDGEEAGKCHIGVPAAPNPPRRASYTPSRKRATVVAAPFATTPRKCTDGASDPCHSEVRALHPRSEYLNHLGDPPRSQTVFFTMTACALLAYPTSSTYSSLSKADSREPSLSPLTPTLIGRRPCFLDTGKIRRRGVGGLFTRAPRCTSHAMDLPECMVLYPCCTCSNAADAEPLQPRSKCTNATELYVIFE
ncbi:hypothetical protein GY45DRAFT_76752 [Cubamyces sp. BRFM 1775]|nr:hypothetical protein GY45DRAFT_76752 [Cubamyces sp. BRFM 1775]